MSLLLALVAPVVVVVVAPTAAVVEVTPAVIGGGVSISVTGGDFTPNVLAAAKARRANVTALTGTVTQAAPLLVQADNATTAVACKQLASYLPVLNHRVLILVVQSVDRVVLGQVV